MLTFYTGPADETTMGLLEDPHDLGRVPRIHRHCRFDGQRLRDAGVERRVVAALRTHRSSRAPPPRRSASYLPAAAHRRDQPDRSQRPAAAPEHPGPTKRRPPSEPSTRKRGPAWRATELIQRRDRPPPVCRNDQNPSSGAAVPAVGHDLGIDVDRPGPAAGSPGQPDATPSRRRRRLPRSAAGNATVWSVAARRLPSLEPRLQLPDLAQRASAAMPAHKVRKSLSQRRFWNTVSGRPAAAACVDELVASAADAHSGLSTTTASPASMAALASGTCVVGGDAITTRSSSSARFQQRPSPRTRSSPSDAAAGRRPCRSGIAGDDRRDVEPRVRRQQGPMEHPTGKAKADQADAQWLRRPITISRGRTTSAPGVRPSRSRRPASRTAPVTMNRTDESTPIRLRPDWIA